MGIVELTLNPYMKGFLTYKLSTNSLYQFNDAFGMKVSYMEENLETILQN